MRAWLITLALTGVAYAQDAEPLSASVSEYEALWSAGECEKARRWADLTLEETDRDLLMELGVRAAELDDLLTAWDALTKVMMLDRDRSKTGLVESLEVQRTLATLAARLGKNARARALGYQCLALAQDTPELSGEIEILRDELALTLAELGELRRARELLLHRMDLEAMDAARIQSRRLKLAVVEFHRGDADGACEILSSALEALDTLLSKEERQLLWFELSLSTSVLTTGNAQVDKELWPMASQGAPSSPQSRLVLVKAVASAEAGAERELLPILLDACARHLPDYIDDYRWIGEGGRCASALYRASALGDVQVIDSLVESKVNPDMLRTRICGWQMGEPRRDAVTALFVAASAGQLEVVRSLLRAGADVEVRCTEDGTALTIAASRKGRLEIVRLLLDAEADVIGPRPKGRTALEWAGIGGDYPTFSLLLQHSREAGLPGDIELRLSSNLHHRNGEVRHLMRKALSTESASPLADAARHGSVDALRGLLAKEADPNKADADGWTPLHWAASDEGSVEATRILLASGADPNAATRDGYTPLVAALGASDRERVLLLLEAGADPSFVDVDGRTALHVAARGDDPGLIRLLLIAGAPWRARNRWTQTALGAARFRGNSAVVAVLEEWARAAQGPTSPDQIELIDPRSASVGELRAGQTWWRSARWRTVALGTITGSGSDVPLAFEIFWRVGDREWKVGGFAAREGAVGTFPYAELVRGLEKPLPERVDIVLRPSRALAFERLMGADAIYGGEITLEDVPAEIVQD